MQRENFRLAVFMLLPTVIILGLVAVYPPIRALDISLHYNNLMKPKKGNPFIWFDNYKATLTDPSFWSSVKTTEVFVAASVTLVMVMALLIAVLLNKKFAGRNFVRALMLVPWAIPTVVNGLIWLWILNPSYGALNGLLSQFGIIDKYLDDTGCEYETYYTECGKEYGTPFDTEKETFTDSFLFTRPVVN